MTSTARAHGHVGAQNGATRGVLAAMRRHPVRAFFALSYLISWSCWAAVLLHGDVVRAGVGWPTHLPGLLGPALAAMAVTAIVDGEPGLRDLWARITRWRVGWGWWVVVLGTLALSGLGRLQAVVAGRDLPPLSDYAQYTGIGALSPLGVLAVAFVLNGLGEETGWRGFAVERLLHEHDLRWTALVVGVGWVGWHLPLFLIIGTFRSFGVMVLGWAVSMLAASVVLTYMYRQGRASILLVAAWHTAFNFTSATEATGALVGTVTSMLVIGWAVWVLRREHGEQTGAEQP